MDMPQPIYIGNDALSELVRYCAGRQLRQLTLVADQNTYAALGQAAEGAVGTEIKLVMVRWLTKRTMSVIVPEPTARYTLFRRSASTST